MLLTGLMAFSSNAKASSYFDGGDGSVKNPYQVSTCTELQDIGLFLSSNFKIMENIDCSDSINWNSGQGFTPIGATADFTGNIEGNGYFVFNLYISDNTDTNVGLIGNLSGSVRDFFISESNILSNLPANNLGAMVGYAHGGASLSQVGVVFSTVGAANNIGGVVGATNGASISGITTLEEMTNDGGTSLGGVVGLVQGETTIQDFSIGALQGINSQYGGGVVGESDGGLYIQRGYVYGGTSIGGDNTSVGGILGYANSENINIYSVMVFNGLNTVYNSSGIALGSSAGVYPINVSEVYFDPTSTQIMNCSNDTTLDNSICNPINISDYASPAAISVAPFNEWDFNTEWTFNQEGYFINLPTPLANQFNNNVNNQVGNWQMDEGSGTTTADSSGTGSNGTFNNSPNWTNGYVNYGLNFNGSESYSSVSTNALWPESSGSLSEWVNPTSANGGYISPTGWKNWSESYSYGYVLFDQNGDGKTWRAVFNPNDGVSSPGEADVVDSVPISFGQWTNLTMTWYKRLNTYFIKFYVNGEYIGSTTWTGLPGADGMSGLAFGNSGIYPDNFFNGSVDNVLLYNRNLNDSEVAQIASEAYSPIYNNPPQNLNVTSNNTPGTTLTATISWQAPVQDYVPPIDSYRVYYKDQNTTTWQYLTTTGTGNPTVSYTGNFQPGVTYQFEVCAVSNGGCGPYANITYTMPSPNVYTISNCLDLQNLDNSQDIYGVYQLSGNIDCSDSVNWNNGAGFIPIGFNLPGAMFQGVFDGKGYTIKGVYENYGNSCDGIGIFSKTYDAVLKNVTITNSNINNSCDTGTLSGISWGGDISNIHIENGIITGNGNESIQLGGIFGVATIDQNNNHINISNSYFTGTVGAPNDYVEYIGGIAGTMGAFNISNSYSNALINGYVYAGGLAGYTWYPGSGVNNQINDVYAAGTVNSCYSSNGGLIGYGDAIDIHNSFVDAVVNIPNGCESYTGALVGNTDYYNHIYDNNYYDQTVAGVNNCFGYNPYPADACTAVNTTDQPSAKYFVNNSLNSPLDQWDFNNIWYKSDNNLPLLRDTTNHNTLPVIHLNGDSTIKVVKGSSFTDPGAYVTDLDTNVLMQQIKVTGTVDVNVAGTYYITYNVMDNYGNIALTVTRTVVVYIPLPISTPTAIVPSATQLPSTPVQQTTNNSQSNQYTTLPNAPVKKTSNKNFIIYYAILAILILIIFAIIRRRKKGEKEIEN